MASGTNSSGPTNGRHSSRHVTRRHRRRERAPQRQLRAVDPHRRLLTPVPAGRVGAGGGHPGPQRSGRHRTRRPALGRPEADRAGPDLAHLRRRRQPALLPVRHREPHHRQRRTHPPGDEGRHRRHRGRALLPAQRRRPAGRRARARRRPQSRQDRRGRLDHHPAAGRAACTSTAPTRRSRASSARRCSPGNSRSQISKDEILDLYLNTIYFGSNAYGVEAAARTYFDKEPSELTLPEAALLAGLPQAPSDYSPRINMRRRPRSAGRKCSRPCTPTGSST